MVRTSFWRWHEVLVGDVGQTGDDPDTTFVKMLLEPKPFQGWEARSGRVTSAPSACAVFSSSRRELPPSHWEQLFPTSPGVFGAVSK
ncbi:hypothetical protein QTO34_001784 [Cnephaeus nilssonii]|uniref:Uncharacterized protein n=1 Tax=Cnephaeus nilssonii TaxID=3371016 RepID=A0AA40HTV5_CNENI|nr:hypothetical protein QTO34_001784 [Eptesicus nilssonii]